MTSAGAADAPVPSLPGDLAAAAPVALAGGLLSAAAVTLLGQVPPLLVNAVGGGLAVSTQVRLGWLYTMAGHAAEIEATGSGPSADPAAGPQALTVRLGLLTIAAVAIWSLAIAGRSAARRVQDQGSRRACAGALVALPYAAVMGIGNLAVSLRLDTGGGLLPGATTFEVPVREAFVLPAVLALATGAVAGWSVSSGWRGPAGVACWAGMRTFAWACGLALVGLLAFAAVRPPGLERYVVEMSSGGAGRAGIYVGHQALLAPNQAMWILAPSMGACDSVRVDGRSQDLLCLDRLPRGADPATWLLAELGRAGGSPPVAPMPPVARAFLLVPAAAVVLGVRRAASHASSAVASAVIGAGAGMTFATLVVVMSAAGSLWVSSRSGETIRTVAMGPDPVPTALAALAWGVVGGAVVALAGRRWPLVSGRARPR